MSCGILHPFPYKAGCVVSVLKCINVTYILNDTIKMWSQQAFQE
jgi:hypothetical protein